MNVFALGDLHLSFADPKPMDIFGEAWRDHARVMAENWRAVVGPDDLVVVPGDISWAMRLPDALPDLAWIESLPGRKVLLKGNHDYWWESASKIRARLGPSTTLLQGAPVVVGDVAVAGTRAWTCPGTAPPEGGEREGFTAGDEKIYRREVLRLEASLAGLGKASWQRLVIALHYPPWNERFEPSGFSEQIRKFPGAVCVYGHLHGPSIAGAFQGEKEGVRYVLASADAVGFRPVPLF
jgi:hypothetical protein